MSIAKRRLFSAALFFESVLFIFVAGCATLYNPATGRKEFIIIPTDYEVSMGKNIHSQIISEYGISPRQADAQKLTRIGQRLAKVSDRQDYEYHFYLVDKKDINAFTTPGGNIYFFTGLLDKLKTDDEIAAVLAHEVGHCAARHTIKKYQAALGYNLIGALVFSQVNMGDTAKGTAALAANVAMELAMSAYSRQDEYAADRLGVKYMYLAGYDLNGMIETLEVLDKESSGVNAPLILRTHPYVPDRIKAVREEIKQAPIKYGRDTAGLTEKR
ncbi:MAG TPA: M48 family metallopeptidase [Candidatus Omnitrophota bacterium]|nr:M48 family metallopeptidase [Candidatus Omnitrophota bacterium]HPD84195.1 M48 family metallopeptidase [Candidatus Omnitrophota bacterium]HRZ03051.1 M48 family metallopeptidase [Candidatus Omnitrophota bacterium]